MKNKDNNLIHCEWEEFSTKIVSPHAPDLQVREMKIAFYCGVQAFFSILVDSIAVNNTTHQEAVAKLYQVKNELDKYRQILLEEL